MDFGFSEQQRDVQNLAREMLSDLVTPETLAAYDDWAAPRFDQALWQKLAEAGLLGVAIDEQHGGMGFGFIELALLAEEVGRTIAPVPLLPHLVSAAMPIQAFGSDEQKQRWLPAAAAGSAVLTAALTETGLLDPVADVQCRAEPDGDGYRLQGAKPQVPFARQAARILVPAQSPDGVVLVLVDPTAAGVSLEDVWVTNFEPACSMQMDGVRVEAADVLAGPEQGSAVLRWTVERTIAALCAMQTGMADHVMRMTASYTAERKQFGVPIATFQAVGHRAANCFIDVQCLQLNTYQAVSILDEGDDATNEVLIAKVWAGDAGHRVSYAAQHLHGGMGVDRDYPLWRYCTWLRYIEASLGGSGQLLARLGERIAAGQALFS